MGDRDNNGGAMIGAALAGLLVLGAVVMAWVAWKAAPHVWRGVLGITRVGVPLIGTILGRSPLGWPADQDAQSPRVATILGGILWGGIGLVGGVVLLVVASPIVILILTLLGMVVGLAAGATAFPPPAPQPHDNLEDHLGRW